MLGYIQGAGKHAYNEMVLYDNRRTHFWALACSGHNVPREALVVRGEASLDAPVPVPGEPVSDGSRVLSFGPLVCGADAPCYCFSNVFNLFALSA